MMQSQENTMLGAVVGYLFASIVALTALFITFGTFGVAYAGASDFSYVWKKLVTDVWRALLT